MSSYIVSIAGALCTGTIAALSAHMLFVHIAAVIAAVIAGTLAGVQ